MSGWCSESRVTRLTPFAEWFCGLPMPLRKKEKWAVERTCGEGNVWKKRLMKGENEKQDRKQISGCEMRCIAKWDQ